MAVGGGGRIGGAGGSWKAVGLKVPVMGAVGGNGRGSDGDVTEGSIEGSVGRGRLGGDGSGGMSTMLGGASSGDLGDWLGARRRGEAEDGTAVLGGAGGE